ncbi:Tripartite-type tricarboxylate transporter, receptor component TctC [Polynucleobacter kasalickyi]|uniref:Tripartite-type tricarboxylate transporter, receptor component TctC n=2 Tax=Polynucleobacter kasalickyi TaxID=1938817 RepID=A0A1W2A5T4_9BURK|nr:Tripartite-type tricarboxylate transporter, receptor component TctC [Polynucleobacter kasalickyi]
MKLFNRLLTVVGMIGLSFSLNVSLQAQEYPNRPIKIVIPYPPGGPSDIVGRLLGQALSESLGKPVIIESKPGAAANIGMQYVARSSPDGYTLLLVSSNLVINPNLYANPGYDVIKDFTPIIMPAGSPNLIVVHPSFPAKNVQEFLALIKANPGKYDFASPGGGSGPHLSAELLKLKLNLNMPHIPFNGGGPALQAVLGNQVPIAFSTLPPAMAQVKSGKLIGIAFTSNARSPALPDIPTLVESGVSDVEGETLQFIMAPAGTPNPIIQKLNVEFNKALSNAELQAKLINAGYFVYNNSPEQTAQKIRTELDKWGTVIKAGKIKPD